MTLYQCLLEKNPCLLAGRALTPRGIVVHSTGANNPTLKRYVQPHAAQTQGMARLLPDPKALTRQELLSLLGVNTGGNDWNRPISPAVCVHGFVGRLSDGTVAAVQTLPWDVRCWGCGSGPKGSYNASHIQFEICEDGMEDPAYLETAWDTAADLCADLCRKFSIPVTAIRSHAESCRDGYASNHGDPDHWFRRFGKTMDQFRADVEKILDQGRPQPAVAAAVQKRFGFSGETMAYLQRYRYAAALLEKLANKP